MKRFTSLFVVVCLLTSGSAFAAGISVATTRGYSTALEVDCPEINLGEIEVLGAKAVTVTAPEATHSFDKGAPTLPRYSAMVMIDPARRPLFQVTSLESEVIEIDARVVPSKGNFTRDIDPNSVPYTFGEMYAEDAWFPADDNLATMGEPFIFRDIRGVSLVVNPVQYNPVQNKLRIHKRLRVSVKSDDQPSKNILKNAGPISKVFEPIYKKTFVNFEQSAKRLPRLSEAGRLLIISYDDFMTPMKPFVEWKKKLGMQVKLVPLSAVGVTNTDIHAFIQDEYNQGGLTHVILVGDAEQVPTLKGVRERADSDPCYVKLAGDDHVPDAIISRITANTKDEVAYQVAKFVNYERFPTKDHQWYTSLLGVASREGSTPDYEYINRSHAVLLKAMFTKEYTAYEPTATKAMIFDAVNEGVSLINYLGHGSGTSWGTTRFNNTDVNKLANGWKLPIIIDVACVNGRFVKYTGFGETWLRSGDIDNPAGAVAYAGATTNMEWVPPLRVQSVMNQDFIAKEVYKTLGGTFIHGILKGLEIYGTDPRRSGVMMFEQWHIFGDATMVVRHKAPRTVESEVRGFRNEGDVTVKVMVIDEDGEAVSNARVTVYTEGAENLKVASTNEEGEAVVTMPAGLEAGYVTIFHSDIVPVVDSPIIF